VHPSGYGEGERYLGAVTVTTDEFGDASFSTSLEGVYGSYLSATATDIGEEGFTSEFAESISVSGASSLASVGSLVWDDQNENGLQDTGEDGLADVTVELYSTLGGSPQITVTDVDGHYLFTNVMPGDYYLRFVAPTDYSFTLPYQGYWLEDSNAEVGTGLTETFTLSAGEYNPGFDAGLIHNPTGTASIEGRAFTDSDGDGIQDTGESGLTDVMVWLYRDDGLLLAGIPTDSNGEYSFVSLAAGDYYLQFEPPSEILYAFSPQDEGSDDTLDSDVDPVGVTLVTLTGGQAMDDLDAGLRPVTVINGFVWVDADGDGLQGSEEVGLEGATISLVDGSYAVVETTTTSAGGYYSFTADGTQSYSVHVAAPQGYVYTMSNVGSDDGIDSDADPYTGYTPYTTPYPSDAVTFDAGLYVPVEIAGVLWEDLDADGIRETGEPLLVGRGLVVFDASGVVVRDGVSGADGTYRFDDLAPGPYSVGSGYGPGENLTLPNVGSDDTIDSDLDPVTCRSASFTLASGQVMANVDAGFYREATVGDRVWMDVNGNGIQDAGEQGLDGVAVNLLTAAGIEVATDTTEGGGWYSFTVAHPGDYRLEFVLPTGHSFSPQDVGADDTTDSDVYPNVGRTSVFAVTSGSMDQTHDAGLIPTIIRGRAFTDADEDGIQDVGEGGVAGVTVRLFRDDGFLVATVLTASAGSYEFVGVAPGTYYLVFEPPLVVGYEFSPQDQGSDDTLDSDVDVEGTSALFTLIDQQIKDDLDAGLVNLIGNEESGA